MTSLSRGNFSYTRFTKFSRGFTKSSILVSHEKAKAISLIDFEIRMVALLENAAPNAAVSSQNEEDILRRQRREHTQMTSA